MSLASAGQSLCVSMFWKGQSLDSFEHQKYLVRFREKILSLKKDLHMVNFLKPKQFGLVDTPKQLGEIEEKIISSQIEFHFQFRTILEP